MKKLINYFTENQKRLFFTDSIGAFMTAFSLLVIVRPFNAYFGMSKTELFYLAVIAICYSIYSITCFFFVNKNRTFFIRLIAIANILYCLLTISLLIKNYHSLTVLGLVYFLGEIAIILGLSYVALNVAKNINYEHE